MKDIAKDIAVILLISFLAGLPLFALAGYCMQEQKKADAYRAAHEAELMLRCSGHPLGWIEACMDAKAFDAR